MSALTAVAPVPAHLNTTRPVRQENCVADGREGRVTARGAPRNGLPVGGFYEYRGGGESLSAREAAELLVGRGPVPSRPGRRAPEIARCPDCKQPKPDHLLICSQAPIRVPEVLSAAPVPAAKPAPRRTTRRGAALTTFCAGCGRPKPDSYATCGGSGPCRAAARAPEPVPALTAEPEPVPALTAEPEPEAAPAPAPESAAPWPPKPARRHRKCGYMFGSTGCRNTCGDGAA